MSKRRRCKCIFSLPALSNCFKLLFNNSSELYIEMCNNTIKDNTIKLARSFFNGSLVFNLEPDDIKDLTWDQQEVFLKLTINSAPLKKYPVNKEFCRLFLKNLISNLLDSYQEVHDDLYNNLGSLFKNEQNDEFYYRHYLICCNLEDTVIIKETNHMVVNGTTGLRTWEAAFMLSDWALSNKEVFNSRNILELGSGVGFTGIAISKYCNITSLIMSDHHKDVLATLNDNIYINFPDLKVELKNDAFLYKDAEKTLGVMSLDWNHIDDIEKDIQPDVIIGADIIYDPSIFKPLCNVLKVFCKRNPHLQIYIASVIRNEDTFNGFMETLRMSKLQFEKIPFSKNINLNWDAHINGCLIKITNS